MNVIDSERMLEQIRRERLSLLARQSRDLEAERDSVIPGAWIVRDPRYPGRCNLVTTDGQCTCRQFRTWDRCPHAAVVMEERQS